MSEDSAEREVWINGVEREDGSMLFGFDTDNPEFARGFEMGAAYFQMAVRPDAFTLQIHASNVFLAKRIARALNRPLVVREVEGAMEMVKELEIGPLPERPVQRMPMPMPGAERGPFAGGQG